MLNIAREDQELSYLVFSAIIFFRRLIEDESIGRFIEMAFLNFFRSTYQVRWGYLMAACVVTLLPVLIVYFLAQNTLIGGIASLGLKG